MAVIFDAVVLGGIADRIEGGDYGIGKSSGANGLASLDLVNGVACSEVDVIHGEGISGCISTEQGLIRSEEYGLAEAEGEVKVVIGEATIANDCYQAGRDTGAGEGCRSVAIQAGAKETERRVISAQDFISSGKVYGGAAGIG